jgi:predicted phosphodiesterase
MRYLVISDIHANLEAFEAVLAAQPPETYDAVLMLGDLVGYGADPNAVVDRVRAMRPDAIIRGNHDKVASGVEDASSFNALARDAALWTYEVLTPENREYLAGLPEGPEVVSPKLEICHGTPFDEDAYVFDDLDALRAIKTSDRELCLFGHTHIPMVFMLGPDQFDGFVPQGPEVVLQLEDGVKYLVNPGSVGQPRDGDPRAAYALFDTSARSVTLKRVNYSVEQAQAKIVAAGLPEPLAMRLAFGR